MIRKIFALFCGVIAGMLLSMAIDSGLQYRFPDEFKNKEWGVFIWGEHWFLRVVASVISAAWAGFIAGVVARDRGKLLGIAAIFPSWSLWLIVAYTAFTGHVPFLNDYDAPYISLGNKIAIVTLLFVIGPVAWLTGQEGEIVGQQYASHFDSRPRSLLGLKWYHHIWLPLILYPIIMQSAYVGFYFLTWFKILWKTHANAGVFSILPSLIPTIFTFALLGTLFIMWNGLRSAYFILAGLNPISSISVRTKQVAKYLLGYPIIAVILQSIIEYIHFFLAKWLNK